MLNAHVLPSRLCHATNLCRYGDIQKSSEQNPMALILVIILRYDLEDRNSIFRSHVELGMGWNWSKILKTIWSQVAWNNEPSLRGGYTGCQTFSATKSAVGDSQLCIFGLKLIVCLGYPSSRTPQSLWLENSVRSSKRPAHHFPSCEYIGNPWLQIASIPGEF